MSSRPPTIACVTSPIGLHTCARVCRSHRSARSPLSLVPTMDPDELYRQREDLASAVRAADVWAQRASIDVEAAWKLARACYWLGTHQADQDRETRARARRDRRARARFASRQSCRRPFLARGQHGTAGRIFRYRAGAEVPRANQGRARAGPGDRSHMAGRLGRCRAGSVVCDGPPTLRRQPPDKPKQHLRLALDTTRTTHPRSRFSPRCWRPRGGPTKLGFFLRRVIDAPFDAEWAPEDRELKRKAAARLKEIGG